MARDFTWIDDIIDGVMGLIDNPPASGEHRLFNIGDSRPVHLLRMIEVLERAIVREAVRRLRPKQPGDVGATWADVFRLPRPERLRAPKVIIEEELPRFVHWCRGGYG